MRVEVGLLGAFVVGVDGAAVPPDVSLDAAPPRWYKAAHYARRS